MAWNEPGGNNQDPWGGRKGGGNQGPPDLDEAFKKMQDKLNGMFGGGKSGSNKGSGGLSPSSIVVLLFIFALIYGASGFYQVNEQERAVVLRFGLYSQTKGPGLHWNPPLVDNVTRVNVTRVRLHGTKGEMLTEDLNIVEVNLSVQYSIADAQNFVLKVRDPERSLAQASDSALRHIVGSTEMHSVLTEGREQIAVEVATRLQSYLDNYNTGIQIEKVNVEETNPPDAVQEAFDDVNKAREDEERSKNEAEAYANGIIPEARGKAQRMLEEASAYQAQVVAQSKGEAQRFTKLLKEYKKAPEVTRERLYLDAVQQVMSSTSKVMVDIEGGNNMMYLPLDKLVSPAQTTAGVQGLTPEALRDLSNRLADYQGRNTQTRTTRRREVR